MSKKKWAVVSMILVAIIVIAVVSFQYGIIYQRNAVLNLDVGTMSFHMHAEVEFANGTIVDLGYHAGVLTTIGKNYIEGKLGDSAYGDNTAFADDISVSTSTSTPNVAWTEIPTEITTGGLERASSTYTSTGDGVWTISHEFTASATHTAVQLTGLQWKLTPLDGTLLGADTFAAVTLNSGDKLTVTWTITVS